MQKEITISILEKTSKTMYVGKANINMISDNFASCFYNLTNEHNPSQKLQGNFEGNYSNLAQILQEIDSIVNSTISEAN